MSDTDRHHLPLLAAGQAQKEITHNEALAAIDRVLQLAVLSRRLPAPPADASAGDSYIVPAGAVGSWAGQSGTIASHNGFGWSFTVPVRGCLAWVADESCFSVFDNGWTAAGWPVDALVVDGRRVLGAAPVAIAAPASGGTVDTEARLALGKLMAALRDQGVIM